MVKYTTEEKRIWLENQIKETREKLKYLEDRYYDEVLKPRKLSLS